MISHIDPIKVISPQRYQVSISLLTILSVGLLGSQAYSSERIIPPKGELFTFLRESKVYGQQAGMAMICPAHAHGTPEEAKKKLQDILKQWPKDKAVSIWVCRANQLATLEMFAPLANRVFINPFIHDSQINPTIDDAIWPNANHPILNHIRQVRKRAHKKSIIACININGEKNRFRKRKPSFEEIKWMVLSSLGGNYQGIVWRGNPKSLPYSGKLQLLEDNIMRYSHEIGSAAAVRWAESPKNVPISVLKTQSRIYMVILNPSYFRDCGAGPPKLPLSDNAKKIQTCLKVPKGYFVTAAQRLDGRSSEYAQKERIVKLDINLIGGGEMITLKYNHGVDGMETTKRKKNMSTGGNQ